MNEEISFHISYVGEADGFRFFPFSVLNEAFFFIFPRLDPFMDAWNVLKAWINIDEISTKLKSSIFTLGIRKVTSWSFKVNLSFVSGTKSFFSSESCWFFIMKQESLSHIIKLAESFFEEAENLHFKVRNWVWRLRIERKLNEEKLPENSFSTDRFCGFCFKQLESVVLLLQRYWLSIWAATKLSVLSFFLDFSSTTYRRVSFQSPGA